MTRHRAAVLGSPIAHSLSPVLHRAAYTALGIDGAWTYTRHDVDEPALPAFLAGCGPEWAGLSLTMPLKRAALEAADTADGPAAEVGAANTLVFRGGRLSAHNTDVVGIERALKEGGAAVPEHAAVLGGGATAASAVCALHRYGAARITVLARDPARAAGVAAAAERAGAPVTTAPLTGLGEVLGGRGRAGLVASTLPAGAADPLAGAVAASGADVFDVVYSPWPTALGAAAERAGARVIGGLPMLFHQAAAQVELMTGCARAPVEAMRAALEAELARRGG